jgi:cytochrome c1
MIDGKGGRTGKPLDSYAEGKTDDQLKDGLLNPKKAIGPDPRTPSYKDKLTDDEVKAVIAYIRSLKK